MSNCLLTNTLTYFPSQGSEASWFEVISLCSKTELSCARGFGLFGGSLGVGPLTRTASSLWSAAVCRLIMRLTEILLSRSVEFVGSIHDLSGNWEKKCCAIAHLRPSELINMLKNCAVAWDWAQIWGCRQLAPTSKACAVLPECVFLISEFVESWILLVVSHASHCN